ncbi:MAG: MBL fold metallo-hydrolase [Methanoregulaceae archaeon]|nr:MBL fold metallo-hydrolase [Methanoregulaceae archaeon]
MKRYAFIIRVPDEPGALGRAAGILTRHGGNINRIQFDRRIDPVTVFFEVTAADDAYEQISRELEEIGYLQSSLKGLNFLRFTVELPHRSGALDEFLHYTTSCRANIAFIDFDDKGAHPDRVTMSLHLGENGVVDRLLDQLKSRYRINILEYDTTGRHLDETIFYLRFAQRIREIIGDSEDTFLLRLLGDINHIAQELMNLGKDPQEIFDQVLTIGTTLGGTTGTGFYADIQRIPLGDSCHLTCIQPPCGGSIFLIETPGDTVMVDTGYGIYYSDVAALLGCTHPGVMKRLSRIIITHADADHCGSGGFYPVTALMHRGTREIINEANRAYGSRSESSILEEVYTTLINLFSRFSPPEEVALFPDEDTGKEDIFPVISRITIGPFAFDVLEGRGGHQYGQIYLLCREAGLLFTGDTVINFRHISPDRAAYNAIAVFLVTSVNVDRGIAKTERQALLDIAAGIDRERISGRERPCLICGGHGPVSVLSGKELVPFGPIGHYPDVRHS